VAILCLGGLRQVERIWEIKGYNARRAAVDNWYASLTQDTTEQETKKRRGVLGGLKRKKSSLVLGKNSSCSGISTGASDSAPGSRRSSNGKAPESLVYCTSLAAGMPMPPLSPDEARLLLPDLPNLQDIWAKTAEALILERRIVERPSDIRRNAQIFTELIREDACDDEDEWLYGNAASDSVRPNLDAIEEDPLE